MGGAYALDFGAVVSFAGLRGGLSPEAADLLGDVLPEVEAIILAKLKPSE